MVARSAVRCLLDAVESNKRYTLGGSHEKVYLPRFRYRLCCEYYAYNRYSRFCRAAACEEILTHFWPRMGLERVGLDGNNGKSAELMAVKSTKRSRNGSVFSLRQPTDQKARGSNPSRRATLKSLLVVMISGVLHLFLLKKVAYFQACQPGAFSKRKNLSNACLTPV